MKKIIALLLAAIGVCLAVMVNVEGALLAGISVYTALITLLGLHLGGCSGDIYFASLLLFKFKSPDTLARDTGPEQFIYVKKEDKNQYENA